MSFEIDGLSKWKEELAELNEKFPEEKEKEMKKLGFMAMAQIKPLVPVDTGRLRNSLSFALGASTSEPFKGVSEGTMTSIDQNTIEAITNVEYASWVNDGHTINSRFLPAKYLDTPSGRKYLGEGNTKGIMLHYQYILGKHYMEKGMQNAEPQIIAEIDRWLNSLFNKE